MREDWPKKRQAPLGSLDVRLEQQRRRKERARMTSEDGVPDSDVQLVVLQGTRRLAQLHGGRVLAHVVRRVVEEVGEIDVATAHVRVPVRDTAARNDEQPGGQVRILIGDPAQEGTPQQQLEGDVTMP